MNSTWPAPPRVLARERLADRVVAQVRDGRSVVLAAPPGSGASLLARQVSERLDGLGVAHMLLDDAPAEQVAETFRSGGLPVVIATREPWDDALAAGARVVVHDEAVLRFTAAEIAELAGADTPAEEVDEVFAVTGGWPAGVVWRLSADHRDDPIDGVLAERCLQRLSAEQLEFAQSLAVVAPCTVGFASRFFAAVGQSIDMLATVARLVPLVDVRSGDEVTVEVWPMVAAVLQSAMVTRRPGAREAALAAAAALAEGEGDLTLAYRYLDELGDREGVARFLYRSSRDPLVQNNNLDRMERWLQPFTTDEYRTWPRLAALQAGISAFRRTPHEFKYWAQLAQHDDPLAAEVGVPSGAELALSLRTAYEDGAPDAEPPPIDDDVELRPATVFSHLQRVYQDIRRGRLAEAHPELYRLAPYSRPYEILEYLRHVLLTQVAIFEGREADAKRHITDAARFEARGEQTVVEHIYDSAAALVALPSSPDVAAHLMARGLDRLEIAPDRTRPGGFISAVFFLEVALGLGDLVSARRAADLGAESYDSDRQAAPLRKRFRVLRDRLALAVETREQMVEQLTPQEQRVAAMLDSPRKAGDIADELGLAEATVRSHVKAIYRKLGTTSRIETVDRLRALGIRGRG